MGHTTAVAARADAVVARSGDDFAASTPPVYTPAEKLAMLGSV